MVEVLELPDLQKIKILTQLLRLLLILLLCLLSLWHKTFFYFGQITLIFAEHSLVHLFTSITTKRMWTTFETIETEHMRGGIDRYGLCLHLDGCLFGRVDALCFCCLKGAVVGYSTQTTLLCLLYFLLLFSQIDYYFKCMPFEHSDFFKLRLLDLRIT